jgi:methionine synthase / methylenetetrahydrofolate reductase(NADPH)
MARLFCDSLGITLADGGIGTEIRRRNTADLCEAVNLHDPATVRAVHADYLRAGARILTANSFCAQPHFLARFGYDDQCARINETAVRLACEAIREVGVTRGDVHIAGSIGPGSFPPTADIDQMRADYVCQVSALCRSGADLLVVESGRRMIGIRAALEAIAEEATALPCVLSISPEENGSLPNDIGLAELLDMARQFDVTMIGLNCGNGPKSQFPLLDQIQDLYNGPLWFRPSAGLPTITQGTPAWPITPSQFAEEVSEAIARFAPTVVGGCCGAGPAHIAALRRCLLN